MFGDYDLKTCIMNMGFKTPTNTSRFTCISLNYVTDKPGQNVHMGMNEGEDHIIKNIR